MPHNSYTFRCPGCRKTFGTVALAKLAETADPKCPKCSAALNWYDVKKAANIKHDEAKGVLLLPVIFISICAHIGVSVFLGNITPDFTPLYAVSVIVCAIVFAKTYTNKGGSGITCVIMTVLFGPISGAFLAISGSWRSKQ